MRPCKPDEEGDEDCGDTDEHDSDYSDHEVGAGPRIRAVENAAFAPRRKEDQQRRDYRLRWALQGIVV